jgi:predicted small secreted protein
MNPKKLIGIGIGIVVVLVVAVVIFKHSGPKTVTLVDEEKRRAGPCPGEVKTVESDGKHFQVTENWYSCKPQVAGDWVYYRYSFSKPAVVRKVVAIPGDVISIKKDEANKTFNLLVNKKLVVDENGKPHFFGNYPKDPVLSLYAKEGENKLKAGQSVVFGDTSPSMFDSGMFGVVNTDDFLGKAEEIKK